MNSWKKKEEIEKSFIQFNRGRRIIRRNIESYEYKWPKYRALFLSITCY